MHHIGQMNDSPDKASTSNQYNGHNLPELQPDATPLSEVVSVQPPSAEIGGLVVRSLTYTDGTPRLPDNRTSTVEITDWNQLTLETHRKYELSESATAIFTPWHQAASLHVPTYEESARNIFARLRNRGSRAWTAEVESEFGSLPKTYDMNIAYNIHEKGNTVTSLHVKQDDYSSKLDFRNATVQSVAFEGHYKAPAGGGTIFGNISRTMNVSALLSPDSLSITIRSDQLASRSTWSDSPGTETWRYSAKEDCFVCPEESHAQNRIMPKEAFFALLNDYAVQNLPPLY